MIEYSKEFLDNYKKELSLPDDWEPKYKSTEELLRAMESREFYYEGRNEEERKLVDLMFDMEKEFRLSELFK